MADSSDFAALEMQSDALAQSLGDAGSMAASFESELTRVRQAFAATSKDTATLERGLSRGLKRAFDQVVFDGESLSGALDGLARSLINTTYNAALRPVTNHIGGMISGGIGDLVSGLLPFADGAAFSQGRVMPFAKGGVVTSPVQFPMRGGLGLMGEAGPEAILPLSRGRDGKLGVQSLGGGGATNVVMNISTPDLRAFERSRTQIAAQAARAMSRANRNR
ncbi:putative phage tail minor protein [Roseobacter sp. SK209-2-6]|uniref:phage tail tape measure protein n=1 Tax=Roseobacter sp. SK209-2-6 TaxID=388739 RepID=UPI0000F3E740|nr:phage tail tape measure protein [Roseobacter sp. SK209-2-6]EBA16159.1 putative phage tail minor protein [Roseobacter sp. SK209-2-6]